MATKKKAANAASNTDNGGGSSPAQELVESVRAYCEAEGISVHDPLTLDTLTHAVLFKDGQPKASKRG
jgi:hypothetical protein